MTYTLQQQAFTISVLSNNVAGQKGDVATLESDLVTSVNQALTNPAFTKYIGTWKLVWGPVIWQDTTAKPPSTRADNVMMAAQDTSGNIVVGIAGTNPNSAFDRGIEDLDVGTTVPFPGSESPSWLSFGASQGIAKLEAMTDASGDTLAAFLQKNASTTATLVIAGHSLGGALAPAFAIDLLVNQGVAQSSFANVFVYATAGPTGGNQDFVNLFTSMFPAQGSTPATAWNQVIVNQSDAVPRAWNDIGSLPTLYPEINNGNAPKCIGFLLTDVLQPALNGNTNYAPIPSVTFNFGYNESITPPLRGVTCQWLAQAIWQHIPAYFVEIVNELSQGNLLQSPILPGDACAFIDAWCDKHRVGTND
ncbi:MAG TPA: hypothetical protein VF883_12850 [Thermoanaerobaculia bacterium]|jgi:hypothetical protein